YYDTARADIYTLSLHDALPISITFESNPNAELKGKVSESGKLLDKYSELFQQQEKYYENKVTFKQKIKLKDPKETTIKFSAETQDRKSTRLNSSHVKISYAVFC